MEVRTLCLVVYFSSQSAVNRLDEGEGFGGVIAVEVVGVHRPHEGAGEVHGVAELDLRTKLQQR